MGLLTRVKEMLTGGGRDADPAPEPQPAMDAPFGNHDRTKPRVPSMSEADTAAAGFPSELT